jgi:hypothetical protein
MTGLTFIKLSFVGLKRQKRYVRRFSIRFILSDLLALKKIKSKPGEISTALQNLREILNKGDPSDEHRIPEKCTADNDESVDIFITFDEAHTLSECFDKHANESRFIALRRVLNGLKSKPLFTFFLSTTGKITQFGQPRGRDPSTRIFQGHLATPHPYIYLGFDQLMEGCKLFAPAPSKNTLTLEDVISMKFASHLGRPL